MNSQANGAKIKRIATSISPARLLLAIAGIHALLFWMNEMSIVSIKIDVCNHSALFQIISSFSWIISALYFLEIENKNRAKQTKVGQIEPADGAPALFEEQVAKKSPPPIHQ